MGFSGIRFRHPINRPGVWDEVAVFQGASYFRAVAHDTHLRPLGPRPRHRHRRPGPGGVPDLHRLLGARAAARRPRAAAERAARQRLGGRRLRLLARARRRDGDAGPLRCSSRAATIATVGIAPLTSMYFFGPERRAGVDDFRDAVHDSDGLRIVNGSGERLWRPLRNPTRDRDLGLRRREPALVRPDPARPRLRALRGRRGALRAAPERLGRAGAATGAAAR